MTPAQVLRKLEIERRHHLQLAVRLEMQQAPPLLIGFSQGVAAALATAAMRIQEINTLDRGGNV